MEESRLDQRLIGVPLADVRKGRLKTETLETRDIACGADTKRGGGLGKKLEGKKEVRNE